jgi:hypothetical protein
LSLIVKTSKKKCPESPALVCLDGQKRICNGSVLRQFFDLFTFVLSHA